jgi:DNA-binding MarR family transcriptional regulator
MTNIRRTGFMARSLGSRARTASRHHGVISLTSLGPVHTVHLTAVVIAYTNNRGTRRLLRIMDKPATTIETISKSCIAVRLRLLNRVVTNYYDDALRSLGLKVSQLNILVVTARLGVARPADVCELLQLDTSTLSRNVERMRANGWLEVVPGDDARTQSFRLTAQGKRLIEKAIPAWEAAQRQAGELLGEDGVALLDQAAKKAGAFQSSR